MALFQHQVVKYRKVEYYLLNVDEDKFSIVNLSPLVISEVSESKHHVVYSSRSQQYDHHDKEEVHL